MSDARPGTDQSVEAAWGEDGHNRTSVLVSLAIQCHMEYLVPSGGSGTVTYD